MAELKTQANESSVEAYLSTVTDPVRHDDCMRVLALMKDVMGEDPKMWGASIVGFGRYRYRYESGREGEWFVTGFSPRKNNLTLYIMAGFDRYDDLLQRLGKYSTGKSCLYVKRLADVDEAVLRELVAASAKHVRETWATA
ncbi:MAG TPA: DUF1801 domain-containing protein [Longimicrobiales bacterium]